MEEKSLTLAELAESTGLEARTIRSYIQRGLLPNADSRGRGAGYTQEHLTRLRLMQSIRKARPNVQLNEIRLLFQQSSPDQIRNFAAGSFTAASSAVTRAIEGDNDSEEDLATSLTAADLSHRQQHEDDRTDAVADSRPPEQQTAADRLLLAMRRLTAHTPSKASRVETWHRISVNADIELSVRGFGDDQLVVFREVADLMRHILTRPDLPSQEGEE